MEVYLRSLTVLLCSMMLMVSGPLQAQEDDAYTLGPGDRVSVNVYGQEDLTTEAEIGVDGTVAMPLLGSVEIAGMTARMAARVIAKRLEVGGYLQNAHVNLLVTEYNSQSVAVLGQVNQPGRITLRGPTTLTEALAMAGGINQGGSERIVLVRVDKDGDQSRREYYLRELLDSQAEDRETVRLSNGDTLYVPLMDQFYVNGQVRNPGTYAIDRPLNVMQALTISGGMNQRASKDSVVLYRQQKGGGVEEHDAELYEPIQDGDVLFVKESLF
ncbi:polysaccharide biosynthesis/export family protein [Marinobacter nanhaiticus D15-8W]|uniref:Polysaccharide export protein EpsE n=1 Tax=Marinobacter nanhaiticus D15-8W TaxID=626887 RepID=N6X146_9GAMM|nr:polysaccharide biosynthesis/export family protein [Marinobacter nanhaiticus]ENO14793.2 polysaccharide export protein EpsE [Marinobacter nanhaiticus D15-8W]BES69518.1 polysaccharide biosynthesis/export family protein [Marinobacter nanhaiticus D15-8W]